MQNHHRNHFLFLLLAGALLVACGCVTHQGDFTVASTKLVRLNAFDLDKTSRVNNVEGEDVQYFVLFFPTGGPPSVKTAMDRALENGNGDVMRDVRIDSWSFGILGLYGENGWSVRGDVVKTRTN